MNKRWNKKVLFKWIRNRGIAHSHIHTHTHAPCTAYNVGIFIWQLEKCTQQRVDGVHWVWCNKSIKVNDVHFVQTIQWFMFGNFIALQQLDTVIVLTNSRPLKLISVRWFLEFFFFVNSSSLQTSKRPIVLKRLTNDPKYSLNFYFSTSSLYKYIVSKGSKVSSKQQDGKKRIQLQQTVFFLRGKIQRNWANNFQTESDESSASVFLVRIYIIQFYGDLVGLVRSVDTFAGKCQPQIMQNDVLQYSTLSLCMFIRKRWRKKLPLPLQTMQLAWFIRNHRKWTLSHIRMYMKRTTGKHKQLVCWNIIKQEVHKIWKLCVKYADEKLFNQQNV